MTASCEAMSAETLARGQAAFSMTLRSSSSLSLVSDVCNTLPLPVNSESPASTLSARGLAHEHEQGRATGLEARGELFIMIVV